MLNDSFPITFGVELEMVLLFHEELIVNLLRLCEGRRPLTEALIEEYDRRDPALVSPSGQDPAMIFYRANERAERGLTPLSPDSILNPSLAVRIHNEASRLLVKNLTVKERVAMRQVLSQYQARRPMYMGWAVRQRGRRSNDSYEKWGHRRHAEGEFRTYVDEVLKIAQEVLGSAGMKTREDYKYWVAPRRRPIDIDIDTNETQQMSFPNWTLANDASLSGVPEPTTQDWLDIKKSDMEVQSTPQKWRHLVLGSRDTSRWDSHGVELISPVFEVNDESFRQINIMLKAIKGDAPSRHGALVQDFCGFHCHIGVPANEDDLNAQDGFDLATLQHLAYILVMYEDHINTIHPPHRREEWLEDSDAHSEINMTFTDIQSNRDAFLDFNPDDTFTLQPLQEVRAEIFKDDQTIENLASTMSASKATIVNWTYLKRLPNQGARTLEFRQHEGALRGDIVRWWVLFCTGLVKLANHMAHPPAGVVASYPSNEWNEDMSLWDLMELMEFPEEGQEYFRRRTAYYARGASMKVNNE